MAMSDTMSPRQNVPCTFRLGQLCSESPRRSQEGIKMFAITQNAFTNLLFIFPMCLNCDRCSFVCRGLLSPA